MKRRNALAVSLFAAWAMPASAETVLVLAGHVITDAARPARGPSTITVTDGRITAIDYAANSLSGDGTSAPPNSQSHD